MEAGRIFVATTGGDPNATGGRRHEATGEKVAEQFPRAVAAQYLQHYTQQLQGISSQSLYVLYRDHYVNVSVGLKSTLDDLYVASDFRIKLDCNLFHVHYI